MRSLFLNNETSRYLDIAFYKVSKIRQGDRGKSVQKVRVKAR